MNTTQSNITFKLTQKQFMALPDGGKALVNCIDWNSSEGRFQALQFAPREVMERYKPLEERNIRLSLKGTTRLTRRTLDFLESQLQELRAAKKFAAAAAAAEPEAASEVERNLRQALGESDRSAFP